MCYLLDSLLVLLEHLGLKRAHLSLEIQHFRVLIIQMSAILLVLEPILILLYLLDLFADFRHRFCEFFQDEFGLVFVSHQAFKVRNGHRDQVLRLRA